ncbi:site-specific DNA-methyltransferase, partial [Luteipulveratus sp. YIM 133132]|uniref:site-specific DNA-methyltransferase n=1 Tax=Luteipulveratus flavus TaxID=3031728 RepID=UPI0023B128B5
MSKSSHNYWFIWLRIHRSRASIDADNVAAHVSSEGWSAVAGPRLELVWPGKDKFLLVPKDADGRPVWVERDHPAASEVRLADLTDSVGDVNDEQPYADNLLFTGDSLDVLRILTESPEYRQHYRGKVKLVYIDPPFNTGQAFEHYDDWMEHSTWLSFMRERLLLIRELLAPDGSVWVHLDEAEMHMMRAVIEEIFGFANFVGTVIWQRRFDPRNTAPHVSMDHDYILIAARDKALLEFGMLPRTAKMDAAYANPDDDSRGPWRRDNLTARNAYAAGLYGLTTPSGREIGGPPHGTYWRVSKAKLMDLDADGRIYWGKQGDSNPYLKRFLSEVKDGRVAGSIWAPTEVGYTRNGKEDLRGVLGPFASSPFSTPKPERLLERVIHIGSNPGDIVLDCFAGSGTTAAVAHKMGRRWVTAEILPDTVKQFTRPRLEKVVRGEDPGGITKSAAWQGGSGFRTVEVGPSMYEETPYGVVLADWATGERFARAVAAQLGFTHQPEAAPLCGKRGRVRLAVLDGPVGPEEVRGIVGHLAERERVVIVATVVLPDAETVLAELSPGSRIRKAPRDLLTRGAERSRRRLRAVLDGDGGDPDPGLLHAQVTR